MMLRNILYPLFVLAFLSGSCKKFLDAKSDKKLVVPTSLSDLQALLDYEYVFSTNDPHLGEVMSDNYYMTTDDWKALAAIVSRPVYIWNPPTVDDVESWSGKIYDKVYFANVILDKIDEVIGQDKTQRDHIKGAALFFRAYAIFKGVQIYTLPYIKAGAALTPGMPYITSSDVNTKYTRSKLSETYERVIKDLKDAAILLPDMGYPLTRPGRAAVFGTLSYIYLITGEFNEANKYADSCLLISNQLMDYNSIMPGNNPFPLFNKEIILQSRITATPFLAPARAKVDSVLYESYSNDDLRKTLYYRTNSDGTHAFQGSYDANPNSAAFFSGIATNEVYLLKAESLARLGRADEAMIWLNNLLRLRWKENTFADYTAANAGDALTIILEERRKELAFRGGIRWTDLRRLNTESDRQITVKRIIDSEEYILPPGDNRYAFPIPDLIIRLGGIEQNPR